MRKPILELEGTWEEIEQHAAELAGRRVRLTVLAEEPSEPYPGIPPEARPSTAESLLRHVGALEGPAKEPERGPPRPPVFRPANGPSTARALLKYAGTWEGDDLEECLRLVYATRCKAKF